MEQEGSFGQWLKRRRRLLDLTQKELARRTGCAEGTIRKIEADSRRPSKQLALLLAQHLQIPSAQQDEFVQFARAEPYTAVANAHYANLMLALSPQVADNHLLAQPSTAQPNLIAGRYSLGDEIGRGGMGIVRNGRDTQTGQTVAIKMIDTAELSHKPHFLERFQREGEALRQLDHPNIVKILAMDKQAEHHYLVMEYMPGGDLRQLLEKSAPLPLPQILSIALGLADALTRAHQLEIIHRDLKPANILLAEDGTPRLTDFGIAHITHAPRITQSNALLGSPYYLSPEACTGEELDGRSDIWALGIILFEMVTGQLPFNGKSFPELLIAILNQPIPDIRQYQPIANPDLAALINAMLTRDRAMRIRTMRQVASQLEAITLGQPLSPTPAPRNLIHSPIQAQHLQTIQSLSQSRYQIDQRFVKLTLLLDQGPDTHGLRFVRDEKQRQFDDLQELLYEIDEQAVVLLGQPGSGKSTLLRRLQFDLVQSELQSNQGSMVFFVPLNSYRPSQTGHLSSEPAGWLADIWQKRYPDLPEFEHFWQAGQCHLLLDGLNEMPHRDKADYRERIGHWRQFLQETRHFGNRVIISCRSLDYSAPLSSTAVPVRQVRVEPLTTTQIETFLRTYLPRRAQFIWATLRQSENQITLLTNPFFLRLLVEQVDASGQAPTGQAALLTGFVRQALHREITEHTHHLFQPDNLLSEGDYEQVLHHAWLTAYDLPWEGELFTQLEKLAFVMQDGRDSQDAGQVRILEREAISLLDHPQARDIIQAGIQLSILDKEIATRELTFTHQLIQEYFAARLLAQNPDPTKAAVPWRADETQPSLTDTVAGLEGSEPLPESPTTGWEETTVLAAAMSANQEQFVRDLIPMNLPLAARCAAATEVNLPSSLVANIQQALIKRIANPETDLRARITTANSLGHLGDPRFERHSGPHGSYLLAPMAHIPGGIYPIGSDEDPTEIKEAMAARRVKVEQPAHTVTIASFEIGVFPVTNAEYRLFMEGGGYEDEQWWVTEAARLWLREGGREAEWQAAQDFRRYLQSHTETEIKNRPAPPYVIEGLLRARNASDEEYKTRYFEQESDEGVHRQPGFWEDSRFNQPAQPVVGVSWFEALAYCAWLSAQTEENVGLPTEVEWEAAARGKNGRIFAYGNMYDPNHCNVVETHIRTSTPVGIFLSGRTPEKVFDLTGNVWEWTSSIWGRTFIVPDYPYPYEAGDGRENLVDGLSRRVVRGGSFAYSRPGSRAMARGNNSVTARESGYGFRLVRRP